MQTIPITELHQNIQSVFYHLEYSTYKFNRDEGLSHSQLINIGVGNDEMEQQYLTEKQNLNGNTCKEKTNM